MFKTEFHNEIASRIAVDVTSWTILTYTLLLRKNWGLVIKCWAPGNLEPLEPQYQINFKFVFQKILKILEY